MGAASMFFLCANREGGLMEMNCIQSMLIQLQTGGSAWIFLYNRGLGND